MIQPRAFGEVVRPSHYDMRTAVLASYETRCGRTGSHIAIILLISKISNRGTVVAHRLIAYDLGTDRFAIVLAPAHTKSFIEKLVGDPKTRQRANAIVKAMAQIAKNGTKWARQANKLRFLGTSLSLYELKVDGKVIRIMTYVHHDATPVYLFDFDGHQGKHAGIPKHVMDRGKKLAAIAAGLIMEEHDD